MWSADKPDSTVNTRDILCVLSSFVFHRQTTVEVDNSSKELSGQCVKYLYIESFTISHWYGLWWPSSYTTVLQ